MRVLVRSFLWGAIACVPAAVLELCLGLRQGVNSLWAFCLVMGLIEELAKLLATATAAWKDTEFDQPGDGLVCAASAALGFSFSESVGALATLPPWNVATKTLLSIPAQVLFSLFWGSPLGRLKCVPGSHWPMFFRGLITAVFLHGTFDALAFCERDWPGVFILLVLMVVFQWHLYRRMVPFEPLVHIGQGAVAEEKGVLDLTERVSAIIRRTGPGRVCRTFHWIRFILTVGFGLVAGVLLTTLHPELMKLVGSSGQGDLDAASGCVALVGVGLLAGCLSRGDSLLEIALGSAVLGLANGIISGRGIVVLVITSAGFAIVGAFGGWLGVILNPPGGTTPAPARSAIDIPPSF